MAGEDVALRKRQQIAKANRTMFLWVAGVSVVVGIAAVLSIFLFQKLVFNQQIIMAKQTTASVLSKNIQAFPELANNIRALNSNQALLDSRVSEDDTALQSILDALPSTANGSALGASLQSVLLQVEGVSVERLTVDSLESIDGAEPVGNTIPFTFSVSVNASQSAKLFELLQRLERSIRAIDVEHVSVEMGGNKMTMTVEAVASYEPAKTVELKTEMKP